ncbi:hypothetical protein R3P38DRAFT_3221584 [Favolaschia claudopus]|uniref:EthD domain-containing protein n=1 Tax=Favolaschia claudopus TaxID=2862362 RepID=A0AAW0A105_9AGAR
MSATPAKHRHAFIGIYTAPTGVSRNEFNGHMTKLMEGAARLPAVKNLRDLNVIYQTDDLHEHVQQLGLPSPPATALVTHGAETRDDMVKYLRDPSIVQLVHDSDHFGLQAGACAFTADLEVQVDKAAESDKRDATRPHGILIFKVPDHLTDETFHAKINSMIEALLAADVTKKHLIKHSKWIQNDDFTDEIKVWNFPQAERVVVLMLECETIESLQEILGHDHIKQVIGDARDHLGLHIDSNCFAADVVSLI